MRSKENAAIPTRQSRLNQIAKFLKSEYAIGTPSLEECIRQHQTFCNLHDFDRPFDSDKLTVKCCNCSKDIKVYYEDITKVLFCNTCNNTPITKEHIERLQQRLLTIKNKLMQL